MPYTLCCKALLSKQRKKYLTFYTVLKESSKKSPLKFRAKLRHFPRIFKHCDFGCIQSSSLFFLRIFSCLDVNGTNQSNWNKMYFWGGLTFSHLLWLAIRLSVKYVLTTSGHSLGTCNSKAFLLFLRVVKMHFFASSFLQHHSDKLVIV